MQAPLSVSERVKADLIHPQHLLEALNGALTGAAEQTLGRVQKRQLFVSDKTVLDLSARQKALRLRINAERDPDSRRQLRRQRMLILRELHKRVRACAFQRIDEQVREVKEAKDNAQMFLATRQLRIWRSPRLIIHDDHGREVKCDVEKTSIVASYFRGVFQVRPMHHRLHRLWDLLANSTAHYHSTR